MPDMNDVPTTRRDVLEASLDALDTPNSTPEPRDIPDTEAESRVRDESGRFMAKQTPEPKPEQPPAITPTEQQPIEQQAPRLTTWRKEYLPIQEKLAQGLPLSMDEAKKLADYNVQREKEYATGVSTYRAEAQNAKELHGAIEPFLPVLQQHNIRPAEWISNLGRAHQTLAMGSPEQKMQMFAKLAQDYGVPLAAIASSQGGQLDPIVPQLMQEIQNLKQGVNTVTSWREHQEQMAIQQELARFNDAEKYPHFEQVRQNMGQLLESGLAPDLETAYAKAVRMNDDVWQAEQERQATAQANKQAQERAAVTAQAKAKAVSPRSTTPTGQITTATAKDRRSLLAEQLDSVDGGRV